MTSGFAVHEKPEPIWFRLLNGILFVEIVALLEAVNTSAGIDELLLAREKRMALGANINTKILLGRGSLDNLAASTTDRCFLILGMDALFHSCHLFICSQITTYGLYHSHAENASTFLKFFRKYTGYGVRYVFMSISDVFFTILPGQPPISFRPQNEDRRNRSKESASHSHF